MRCSLTRLGNLWRIKIKMALIPDGERVNYSEILDWSELDVQKRYKELIAKYSERSRAILDKRDWPYDKRRLEQAAKKKKEATSGTSKTEN